MRQIGDPHALTHDWVRHHRGGGMTHGYARQRLRHAHCHWCHRHSHGRHRNRRCHPLCNGLRKSSREGSDLGVEVRWRRCRRSCIRRRRCRSTGGSYEVLLSDGPRLQPCTAEGGVSLGNAVIVGTHGTHRGGQTLLSGCRS